MSLWENKFIKPMLAFSSKPFNSKDFLFEIKFDGTRTIAYIDRANENVRFLNRRMVYFEKRYPELEIWKDVQGEKVILDGEIVVFEKGKPNFYKLEEREQVEDEERIEILSKLYPATFIAFDILHLNGKDLVDLPLVERKRVLEDVVRESERILISRYILENGERFFEEVIKKGLEGIVAKKLDSKYEIGKRSKEWLKIKNLKRIDVVVVGYTTGIGKREDFGSLVGAVYDKGKLRYIGKIGTGFDENDIKMLLEKFKNLRIENCPLEKEPDLKLHSKRKVVWLKPELIVEVEFLEFTKEFMLRAPSFIRIREDKMKEDCTLDF